MTFLTHPVRRGLIASASLLSLTLVLGTSQASAQIRLPSPAASTAAEVKLTGTVVSAVDNSPVSDASLNGVCFVGENVKFLQATTDSDGRFELSWQPSNAFLQVQSEDDQLVSFVQFGADQKDLKITLQPYLTRTGQLVETSTDLPLGKVDLESLTMVEIQYGPTGETQTIPIARESVTTDADGKFELKKIFPKQKNLVFLVTNKDPNTGEAVDVTELTTIEGTAEELNQDLGKFTAIKPAPYEGPTPESRLIASFKSQTPIEARWEQLKSDARIGAVYPWLIVADPTTPEVLDFFQTTMKDSSISTSMENFRFVPLSTSGDDAAENLAFLASQNITAPVAGDVKLLIFGEDGNLKSEKLLSEMKSQETPVAKQIAETLEKDGPPLRDGNVLLSDALALAKKENKRVILQEGATWCGPCWMLSRYFDSQKETLSKDYLIVKMDHRWTDAEKIMAKYKKAPGGIPFFAIVDADGKTLITSEGPDGNIGVPVLRNPPAVVHFMQMIRETRLTLTDDDLTIIEAGLPN